jgi:NTE family protein
MARERPSFLAGRQRIGLVFAGGGARGAYQAGVVEYLARRQARVAAIAGASIGALNGAVVGTAESLEAGARRLVALWKDIAAAVKPSAAPPRFPELRPGHKVSDSDLVRLGDLTVQLVGPEFARGFLEALATEFVHADRLRRDLPVWVSVYPSLQPLVGGRPMSLAVDLIRPHRLADAEHLCLNDLPRGEVSQALLASSALPLVLPSRRVGTRAYRDGGLADNTPAAALSRHVDLDLLIVVHLKQGALFDAHELPVPVLEVRPSAPLSGSGLARWSSLLALSPERVEALRRQGLYDAARCLEPADRVITTTVGPGREADKRLLKKLEELDDLRRLDRPSEGP